MIKLKISVTRDILEKSKNCSPEKGLPPSTNCAVALAIRDIFPFASVVWDVFYPFAHHPTRLDPMCIRLPFIARDFIREFDKRSSLARVKMNPISFEIDIPDEVIEKINIDEIRPLLQNHPTLELIEQ